MLDLSASPPYTPASSRFFTRFHPPLPTAEEISWAREVIAAFDAAGGEALRLPSEAFVDLPVADRARRLLQLAAGARS
jgi:citrate lyase beta subunit